MELFIATTAKNARISYFRNVIKIKIFNFLACIFSSILIDNLLVSEMCNNILEVLQLCVAKS